MFALAIAALIAQASPEPESSAQTPVASPSVTASAPALNSATLRGFPRGPRRIPPARYTNADAVIRNGGSTNVPGYVIIVHRSGPADVSDVAGTSRVTLDPADVAALFADLGNAGDLATLPAGHCMKSASFGSTTTLSHDGQTTPDLSCPAPGPLAGMAAVVNRIVGAAHVAGLHRI